MSASAYHRCQHCGYETDVLTSLSVFEEDPHCRHVCYLCNYSPPTHDLLIWCELQCGLSASESDLKMQEDLSNLMARNMHLGTHVVQPSFDAATPPTPQLEPQPAPIAYITQHYHHSSHHRPTVAPTNLEPFQTLAAARIDASVLSPSQLQLFKHAAPDQQLRLIQLWQIAPPTYGQQPLAKNPGHWPPTNLAQEEEAAQQRWLKLSEQEREHSIIAQQGRSHAEPYMIDGYEKLPNINGVTAPTEYRPTTEAARSDGYNRAYDPVYSSREWWQHFSETQPMEHQYGILEQMRVTGYGAVDEDGDKQML
jgi:hypothetical protein